MSAAISQGLQPDEAMQLQAMLSGLTKAFGKHRILLRAVFCPSPVEVLGLFPRMLEARQRVLEAR